MGLCDSVRCFFFLFFKVLDNNESAQASLVLSQDLNPASLRFKNNISLQLLYGLSHYVALL